jgi:hypothetical protein
MTLTEVKNAAQVNWTRQLEDFGRWTQANGYTFELKVRAGASLSGTVLEKISEGIVAVQEFLP